MSQSALEMVARAERQRLHFLSDEDLEVAVAIVRPFVDVEDKFVPLVGPVGAAVAALPRSLHDDVPIDAVVRALFCLARHGIPHGLPTTAD